MGNMCRDHQSRGALFWDWQLCGGLSDGHCDTFWKCISRQPLDSSDALLLLLGLRHFYWSSVPASSKNTNYWHVLAYFQFKRGVLQHQRAVHTKCRWRPNDAARILVNIQTWSKHSNKATYSAASLTALKGNDDYTLAVNSSSVSCVWRRNTLGSYPTQWANYATLLCNYILPQ